MNQSRSDNGPSGLPFAPVEPSRTSSRVADAIRRVILEGQVRPGEVLPTERTLAANFHVTRNTVREALRDLEQLRLVTIRQGSGIRVRDWLATAGLELAGAILRSAKTEPTAWMVDVAEARAVIGRALLGHAVERVTPADAAEASAAIDAFCDEAGHPSPDVGRLQQLDVNIHAALVRASGNRVLVLLHNSIRHIYEHVADLFGELMADPAALVDIYRRLQAALAAGDRETACGLVDAYFEHGRAALGAADPRKARP
jgi:DNA-binding FadR family transcriptional regulator